MKKYSFLFAALLMLLSFAACEEENATKAKEPDGPWVSGPVTDYEVTPINGGAVITYSIPQDPDILYIMAEYERNGEVFTEKASVFANELTIEGFHNVGEVYVILYKVNRFEQRSDPLFIAFEPLESVVSMAEKSFKLTPTFGGMTTEWDNATGTELSLKLMIQNVEDQELVTNTVYYSTLMHDEYSFRGFEAVETTFAFVFEDKWGNLSNILYYTITPFFETIIPKPYADYRSSIPLDNISNLSGRTMATLWDNIVNTSAHGWLTNPGQSGLSMTIDLKQVVKLSRIVIHGYHVNAVYGQANFTKYELWGTDQIDYTKVSYPPYWLDSISVAGGHVHGYQLTDIPDYTFKDDWAYLGWHEIPRYDIEPLKDPEAQKLLYTEGAEYLMPIDAPPVRYLRFFIREIAKVAPGANNYWSCGEITCYGDNTIDD